MRILGRVLFTLGIVICLTCAILGLCGIGANPTFQIVIGFIGASANAFSLLSTTSNRME